MEALHAGDTVGALHALGLKATTKETVVEKVTASLRGELAQAEQLLGFKRTMTYATPAYKVEAIAKAEAKVAKIHAQLAALMERVSTLETQKCPICYDTPQTAALTPCCRQAFCLACLCECIESKPQCPMCRASIRSAKELVVVGEGSADEEASDAPTLPTKGAALLNLLASSTEDQRYLVFSAHEASFKGLRELLSARGIRCEVLQGTSARVDRLRKQFRDGTVRVLCMNARHVGAGINLEAATHVILYHKMNVELERQVIGRAVRFERADELRVVHLVHEHETALNGSATSEVIVHV
jgi:SNF2 family DNA or RNA helicase